MIHVIAIITTKTGKRQEVLTAFRNIVTPVLAEEGCIEYGPTIDAETESSIQTPLGPDTFMVVEKWTSIETLNAHSKSDHMSAYAEQIKDLIDSRVIHVLSPVN